jgi:hypothetical protein
VFSDRSERLIFMTESAMLRAMFRYVILFVGIIWASLLLLSWSDPAETAAQSPPVVKEAS